MSRSNYHKFAACLLCLMLLLTQAPSRANAQQAASIVADELWITVRLSPAVSDETLRLINEIVTPKQVKVERGEKLTAVLKEIYGDAYLRALIFLQKSNPENGLSQIREGKGGQLSVPLAPLYHQAVITPVNKGGSLRAVAERAVGFVDNDMLKRVVKYTASLRKYCRSERGCTGEEASLVKRNNFVALPYSSRYVSFRLKNISRELLTIALSRLGVAQGVTDVEVHKSLRLVPNFDLAQAGEISVGCVTNPSGTDWPAGNLSLGKVSVEDLRTASATTTVAILDTGIAHEDARFTYWQNEPEVNGSDFIDEDRNDYRDDKIGYDFVHRRPYPLDDMFGHEYRNHGTHVAGLACGVFSSAAPSESVGVVLSEASRRVRPMILKVAWENGDVDSAAVIEAIQYAYDNNARIVNMSFSGPTFIKSIKREMARSPEILFVTAAGNGNEDNIGQDLDTADYYPAKFSKDLPNVISVAAHGEHLERPCFSNFGATTVDIAAPGVQIESTIAGGYLKMNGTSQAAPLVTLTAALLNSLGLNGPVQIKQRILTSADFAPSLRGQLTSEGVLNVAKALSFRDDLIELSDEQRTLLRGRIISPPAQVFIGDRAVKLADVRKIVSFSPEAGAMLQRVTVLNGGKLEHIYGTLALPKIKFKEKGKQQCIEVDFNSVRDIIPASVPPSSAETCPD